MYMYMHGYVIMKGLSIASKRAIVVYFYTFSVLSSKGIRRVEVVKENYTLLLLRLLMPRASDPFPVSIAVLA